MAKIKPLPEQFILENLEYSETSKSGLVWKNYKGGRISKGVDAGTLCQNGYWYVKIQGVKYLCHRIVMLLTNEDFDRTREIDHIDRNRANNRKDNLRMSSRHENLKNKATSSDSLSGYKHINFQKRDSSYYVRWIENGKTQAVKFRLDTPENSLNTALLFRQALVDSKRLAMSSDFDLPFTRLQTQIEEDIANGTYDENLWKKALN